MLSLFFGHPIIPEAPAKTLSSTNWNIWYGNPIPSWPIRYDCGTFTSSKNSSAVSDECIPSLLIFLALWTPGRLRGTQIKDLFLCSGPPLVFAKRQIQSAWRPFVIHNLLPFMTKSSVTKKIIWSLVDTDSLNKLLKY